MTVTSNALPLPLSKKIAESPPSNRLPLTLSRKLGTLDVVVVMPVDPVEPPVKRIMQGVGMWLDTHCQSARNINNGFVVNHLALLVAQKLQSDRTNGVNIGGNYGSRLQPFYPVSNEVSTRYGSYVLINNGFLAKMQASVLLANATAIKVSDTVGYAHILFEPNAKTALLDNSVYEPLQPTINLSDGVGNYQHGAFIGNGSQSRTQNAVPVPCRYYPIPEPPPPPVTGACRIRPPSSRLPLALTRKRNGIPSDRLPLPLMCWHDETPTFIPDLRSYIVLNKITATIGGIVIDPIDFDFKCDMSGYCWQGGINISDGEYQKIKAKLDVERGNEPVVTVSVNGDLYAFIAEDVTRNRKFVNYTYNLSGRSVTARLGADYAHAQGISGSGMIDQALYASQIVQQQLADTSITLDRFEVRDWLIPANTYSVTNKTPIAVIGDIAKACGGFVYSDPVLPKLSILPRWRKPAWELATATPDLVVPTGVMASISDKKRVSPRYNAVMLFGSNTGDMVHRALEGMDKQAPIDTNPLYTDRDCVVPQGQAILSDSGTHNDYNIKMLWAEKYNIPLAMPSSIWQISDPDPKDKAWNGVVTGVAFSVKRSNDAPVLWQNVTVDRYLDV